MNVEILNQPSNTCAKIMLDAAETITAEAGAMIAMSGDMRVDTRINQNESGGAMGLVKGLARKLGGESVFMNRFTAGSSGGDVFLATALPGDMAVIELDGSCKVKVQNSSFVACESGVHMNISWGGMKNLFSGESLVWLELSGKGKVIINAFGMIYPVEVDGEYVVDTGNISAFDETLSFSISKVGSWASSLFGGEGLVCRFKGSGTVWCQTHADRTFGRKLTPLLVPKKEN